MHDRGDKDQHGERGVFCVSRGFRIAPFLHTQLARRWHVFRAHVYSWLLLRSTGLTLLRLQRASVSICVWVVKIQRVFQRIVTCFSANLALYRLLFKRAHAVSLLFASALRHRISCHVLFALLAAVISLGGWRLPEHACAVTRVPVPT